MEGVYAEVEENNIIPSNGYHQQVDSVEMTDFSVARKGKSKGGKAKYQELDETAEDREDTTTDKYGDSYEPGEVRDDEGEDEDDSDYHGEETREDI